MNSYLSYFHMCVIARARDLWSLLMVVTGNPPPRALVWSLLSTTLVRDFCIPPSTANPLPFYPFLLSLSNTGSRHGRRHSIRRSRERPPRPPRRHVRRRPHGRSWLPHLGPSEGPRHVHGRPVCARLRRGLLQHQLASVCGRDGTPAVAGSPDGPV